MKKILLPLLLLPILWAPLHAGGGSIMGAASAGGGVTEGSTVTWTAPHTWQSSSTFNAPITVSSGIYGGSGGGTYYNAVSTYNFILGASTLTVKGTGIVSGDAVLMLGNSGSATAFSVGSSSAQVLGSNVFSDQILATRKRFIPARAFSSTTTANVDLAINDKIVQGVTYSSSAWNAGFLTWALPQAWDLGTVTFEPVWTSTTGSGGVVWELAAVATANDDALSTALGTGQTSTDTLIATNDDHKGPASSAITIAGTPAAGDTIHWRLMRLFGDASDTMTGNGVLLGIWINWTETGFND